LPPPSPPVPPVQFEALFFPLLHGKKERKKTRQTETPVYRMRSHHGGRVQRPTTIVDRMITWRCHHNFAWRSWSVKSHSPQPSPQPSGKYDRNIAAASKAKPVDDNSGKNNKTSLPERHPHNKVSIKPPPCMNLASRTKLSFNKVQKIRARHICCRCHPLKGTAISCRLHTTVVGTAETTTLGSA